MRETMRVKRISAYAGVDPTAPSLHLGHLIAFMPLFWMYLHGYGAFTLIGSSTAKIGDPTGRTTGRPVMKNAQLLQNLTAIHYQLKKLWAHVEGSKQRLKFESEWAQTRGVINNNTWWNKQSMLEVLSLLGGERMGPLLGRDSVKTRLEDGSGMSFAEFCYPLMQAWDWYMLFLQRGTQLQIGGSDQYGNILTGAQCVKACNERQPALDKKHPMGKWDQPMGFTVPLLTDSSGNKFGKSAGNAIWLDPFMTSPYDLYGYFIRRPDDQVEKLLKLLTFFPLADIQKVMDTHMQDPPKRVAQHLLAWEVLSLVHGTQIANETQMQHRSIYGAEKTDVTPSSPSDPKKPLQENLTISDMPRIDIQLPRSVLSMSLARIMFAAEMSTSISDADRAIKAGGVYLGGAPSAKVLEPRSMNPLQLVFQPTRAWDPALNAKFLIDDRILLIRKGKHNVRCIEFISEEEWKKLDASFPGQSGTGAFRKTIERIREVANHKREQARAGNITADEAKVDLNQMQIDTSLRYQGRFNKAVHKLKDQGKVKDDDDW